jgi:hypothetical protein
MTTGKRSASLKVDPSASYIKHLYLNIRFGNKEFNSQTLGTDIHLQRDMALEKLAEVSQHAPVCSFTKFFGAGEIELGVAANAILRAVLLAQELLKVGFGVLFRGSLAVPTNGQVVSDVF